MITILMDQDAIEEALKNYTESDLGIELSEKDVSIKLIAGRRANGLRAEISIADRDDVADVLVELEEEESDEPATAGEPEDLEPVIGPFD